LGAPGDDAAAGEPPAEPEEAGPLLAQPEGEPSPVEPGQRSDYTPVNLDMRPAGARKRHMVGKQMGNRELFKGYDAIRRLGNLGESMDQDEERLFNSHYEVQQLIEQLGSRNDEGET
jgi:hypothetical protein